ncbi:MULTISPECIES: hypothetical protein [unclassified Bradyrhizobium]|nr:MULTISPECIES: hypothetical protein [unclassified Bradyrhizobium]WGS19311.1 hypothetical protein MTX22_33650 [Bradyrhizobium sp. ISRA463]WGS26146.1 hypothetical protein MTX19_31165 [Bradyrhizobium sp. ISRA464]
MVWSVDRNCAFRAVLVYCVSRQHHSGRLNLADLLNWDWYDISARLK